MDSRRIYIPTINKSFNFFAALLVLLLAACSFEKETGFNRFMQNVTAHYNILYNANEILRQKQETYAASFIDQYDNILSVYQDTVAHGGAADKDLEAVIARANTIINEKEQSKYIGTAYLVMGKANYLDGKYFDAVELFNYVIRSFPAEIRLTQEAYAWKIRALLYLNNQKEAKSSLDSAFLNFTQKKPLPAEVYATAMQFDINTRNYVDGEAAAKKAISLTKNSTEKLRWTFILGQLQELNHENDEALTNYNRIAKSNASFEMAFNANLNRIRIQEMHNGVKVNRIDLLLSLLKDENNVDFNDQIYFQVAEIYAANKDVPNALKYYRLSARSSLKNQNQKGLAYLRIADIDFNERADYINAKKYYDSTLTNLSPTYPGYVTIQKKNNNLQVLVDKLQIIAREDTLQSLAKLDETTRAKAIDSLVNAHILQAQNAVTASNANASRNFGSATAPANNPFGRTQAQPAAQAATGSSFYFYNAVAVSQGYTDFKRKWGDRKLEDNWRRSNKGNNNIASNQTANQPTSISVADPDALPADMRKSVNQVSAGNYRQQLLQDLPTTAALLAQSNEHIYNAYLDIANFYRDVLEEKKEAITNYELLLTKFPNDQNKAPIYYSLYRLYSDVDAAKSNDYKNHVLKEYPETVFAKVIIDPDYSKKLDDKDAQLTEAYNKVYDLYSRKSFAQVITSADSLLKQYPGNKYTSQIYYLRAIASGHIEKVGPFRDQLQQIATAYPNDQLITPLVKQHLAYVDANLPELMPQPFAIMNTDTGAMFAPPVEYQKDAVFNRNRQFETIIEKPVEKPAEQVAAPEKKADAPPPVAQQQLSPPVNKPKDTTAAIAKAAVINKPVDTANRWAAIIAPPKRISTLFNERDSTNYYFVVNVSVGTTDLSSSRFGIGQYNRINFPQGDISHQLKYVGADNQIIYVGRFKNLEAAKSYARGIIPLMPQIMKVPAGKYSFFIATKENLDKLANKKTLDDYIDYYQQTLLK